MVLGCHTFNFIHKPNNNNYYYYDNEKVIIHKQSRVQRRSLLAYTVHARCCIKRILRVSDVAAVYMCSIVCVFSCAHVSCWSGGYEEADKRSGTRVWQTTEGTPSTPGNRHQKTWLQHNHTTLIFYTLLMLEVLMVSYYSIHRISRELKTKKTSNPRNTVEAFHVLWNLCL